MRLSFHDARFFPCIVFLALCVSWGVILYAQALPQPAVKYDRKGKPNWIEKPEKAFNPAYYVCGVGSGNSQEKADANAFADLIAYFGQS